MGPGGRETLLLPFALRGRRRWGTWGYRALFAIQIPEPVMESQLVEDRLCLLCRSTMISRLEAIVIPESGKRPYLIK